MHKYTMNVLGSYVKEKYNHPECFTMNDLCELKLWAKTMHELLEADKEYHIIQSMESGDDSNMEMNYNEFISRFKKFYHDADVSGKSQIKAEINKAMS